MVGSKVWIIRMPCLAKRPEDIQRLMLFVFCLELALWLPTTPTHMLHWSPNPVSSAAQLFLDLFVVPYPRETLAQDLQWRLGFVEGHKTGHNLNIHQLGTG